MQAERATGHVGNTPGPASVTASVTGLPSAIFHATVNPGTLPITSVENAASNNAPGLPNAAIAQGAIFNIFGFNLGPSMLVVAKSLPVHQPERHFG